MNQSTSSMFTNQADETHLGWFSASIDAHWFETPHPQPQCRSCAVLLFLHINCQIRGRERLPVGPEGVLASCFMWEGQTDDEHTRPRMYIFTHMHVKYVRKHVATVRAIISDTNPQWQCLDYTELSWCNVSPTMVRTFISIPVRLLLPFVRVIYTSVYAHTTCKPAVPPCKENVM